MIKKFFKRHLFFKGLGVVVVVWYLFFSLPKPLFSAPTSTVLFDENHQLLAAKLAADEQWRFSAIDSVPKKFESCVLQFEDAYFKYHPGFNPIAILKALVTNFRKRKIVRGGSTITMQTLRLARAKKSRTLYQKFVELILATRLELRYSKEEILQLYASHTPYGGNIVGLNAAAWRYFGRSPHQLSWGESALLAVLPNAPSLMHPGKNRRQLQEKRNRLLDKLLQQKIIDSSTCFLAKQEQIPNKPKKLPSQTQHLLQYAIKKGYKGQQLVTSIQKNKQQQTVDILQRHYKRLISNHVYNAACLVVDIDTGKVITYVGNTQQGNAGYGKDVDIIQSPRSTGSILKPFLYAAALQEGSILPNMLLPDVPTYIAGYSPKNFSKSYDGAVPANQALSRSLNVPAVRMLRDYSYERFHNLLRKLNITSISKPADHYGLSLILGGAEASLWELTNTYAQLARTLKVEEVQTQTTKMPSIGFLKSEETTYNGEVPLSKPAVYLMLDAMLGVQRPEQEDGWQYFDRSQQIAWKTGTSFGNRDAWSIGVGAKYVVGVWVGNADGEGRSELTGTKSAAPIMFDVFRQFDTRTWFLAPDGLFDIETCSISGYKAGQFCEETTSVLAPKNGLIAPSCPFHKRVHLSLDGLYQLNSSCAEPFEMLHKSWFVLPPTMEWYYKKKYNNYEELPPFKIDCQQQDATVMEVVYPKNFSKLFIPKELNGQLGKIIFKIAHRQEHSLLYWHIDNEFVGQTSRFHQLALQPKPGKHQLTLIDQNGNRLEKFFEILE